MNEENLYKNTPPVKLFFSTAIPGVISMIAMSIYSILEGIFVGQFAGQNAFAAMSLAMPFVMINFALSDMVGVGSAVPISIAHGEKDEQRANNIFSCAFILIIGLAVTMGMLIYILAPFLIQWMGADGQVAELAITYLRVNAVFSPATTLVFAMDNYLRISGYIKGSMFLNIFMSILQVVMLVTFVGVLKWGLIGSALSINGGMAICTLIALIPFVRGKALLKFTKPKFSKDLIKKIVTCGSPTFLNNIAGRLFSIVMNALLIRMGGSMAVATFTVLMYSSDLVQPLLYGLCDSLQPAVGYNWGARAYGRVKTLAKCIFSSSAIVSVVAFVILFIFPESVASLFVEKGDTALLDSSVHALRLFSIEFFFWWFGYAAQSFYNAIEKPKNAVILTVSTALVFPLVMVVVLWPLGLNGLWLNQAATYIPVGVIAFIMLRKTWKEKKIYEKMNKETCENE